MDIVTLINDYGFPTVAVFFLAYFVYFLWKFITTEITQAEFHVGNADQTDRQGAYAGQ